MLHPRTCVQYWAMTLLPTSRDEHQRTLCCMKVSISPHIAGVMTWPRFHSLAGSGDAATLSSMMSSSLDACRPHAGRAAPTASSTPARGHRGSAALLAISSGRGAMQASECCASKASTSPGSSLSQASRTHAVPVGTPRSWLSSSKKGCNEPTRACQHCSRRAYPKCCTPMAGAGALTRSSTAAQNHTCMPPSEMPKAPTRWASMSSRVSR
mmetsp:Transcript_8594/g.18818  ORF Transcript_8594/g.18818 Transcript_8594/m.18818 type:complete len:211 (-) Transcript_8594:131-763(-)